MFTFPDVSLHGKEAPSSPPCILAPCIPSLLGQRDFAGCPTHSSRTQPPSVMGKERTTVRKMSSWSKRANATADVPGTSQRHLPQQFTKDLCAPVTKVNGCRKVQEMLNDRLVETDLHRRSKSHIQRHSLHLLHLQKVLQ